MSHAAWNAVTPYLCSTRRVIAFDIAGFGLTPPLPRGTLPTMANLVEGLDRSLHEMDIELPVDLAGNSLGGSIALEAASYYRGVGAGVTVIQRSSHVLKGSDTDVAEAVTAGLEHRGIEILRETKLLRVSHAGGRKRGTDSHRGDSRHTVPQVYTSA